MIQSKQDTGMVEDLRTVVSRDLQKKLEEFRDPKKGARIVAQQMGIHLKTFKRLLNGKNTANYLTLYKIYRVLLNTHEDGEILKLAPQVVADEIRKLDTKRIEDDHNRYFSSVGKALNGDPVCAEIYFLAGTGPITKEFVSFRFGTYGEDRLKAMLRDGILDVLKDGQIILGKNRSSFSTELIKKMGLQLTDRYFKPHHQ